MYNFQTTNLGCLSLNVHFYMYLMVKIEKDILAIVTAVHVLVQRKQRHCKTPEADIKAHVANHSKAVSDKTPAQGYH